MRSPGDLASEGAKKGCPDPSLKAPGFKLQTYRANGAFNFNPLSWRHPLAAFCLFPLYFFRVE